MCRHWCCLPAALAAGHHFLWISDLHLDLLYNHNATQSTYCRNAQPLNYTNFQHKWSAHFQVPDIPAFNTQATPRPQIVATPDTGIAQSLLPAYHGRYGCDTPSSLLWSSFLSLRENVKRQRPSFVLVTGDLSGHYWLPETKNLRYLTMYASTELLKRSLDLSWSARSATMGLGDDQIDFLSRLDALPVAGELETERKYAGPQLVICVGNNDMASDYRPTQNSVWNEAQFRLWEGTVIPADQKENFLRGQYYTVLVKDAESSIRVVCLNSVWFSRQASEPSAAVEDPADQFKWLKQVLEDARKKQEHVIIAGHVPPVQALYRNVLSGFTLDNQWHTIYAERYRSLVREYGDTIMAQLFGHLHTDEFRVQYESAVATEPCGLVLMAPSVCANHGTNPSWRKVHYDGHSLALINYTQIYTPLYGHGSDMGTFDGRKLPSFTHKYTSTKHFGQGHLTARNMQTALDRRLLDDQVDARRLWTDELVSGGFPPPFLLRCVIQEKGGAAHCLQALLNTTLADTVSLVTQ